GREARIGTAQVCRHLGMAHGQSPHVRLLDHRVVPGNPRRAVIAPGEGRVGYPALGCACRAVTLVEGEIALRVSEAVAEMRIAPDERPFEPLGVGLDEELVGIEALPLLRAVGSMGAIAVEESRLGLGKVAVPDLIRALAQLDALQL